MALATDYRPRSGGSFRFLACSALALAALALVIVFAALTAPRINFSVDRDRIAPDGGHAFVITVPSADTWTYRLVSDQASAPARSRLKLFEDGRPLGPAHAQHADIRATGAGAFSHWDTALFFSSTDGSDPRKNGRLYTVQGRYSLQPEWRAAGIVAGVLALLLGVYLAWPLATMAVRSVPRRASAVLSSTTAFRWRIGASARTLVIVAAIVGFGASVFATGAWLAAPTRTIELAPSAITPERGFAYVGSLPAHGGALYSLAGDTNEHPRGSSLLLLENGRPLGPPHGQHQDIRETGRGRYSHWGDLLLFSTSDNSDPRSNARVYSVEVRLFPRPAVQAVGWGGLLVVLAALACLAAVWPETTSGRAVRRFGDHVVSALRPATVSVRTVALIAALAAIAGICAVVVGWQSGQGTTSASEISRYFPISDASSYHGCATALAAKGSVEGFSADWCVRRVLYVSFLATVLPAAGWSSQIALLVQGAIVGAAIGVLATQVAVLFGAFAAMAAAVLLSAFAWEFALGLFMTEALGFPVGLLSLALLLSAAVSGSRAQLLTGAALLSIAMTSRAGAVLVLPVLVLWSGIAFADGSWRSRIKTMALTAAAVAVGPLLQYGIVVLLGADPSNSGGNFAASIYALSTGSRDWSDAYRDFQPLFAQGEKEAFKEIYGVAFDNISSRPGLFLTTLWHAGQTYVDTLYSFGWIGQHRVLPTLLTLLTALGLLIALLGRRRHGHLLVALAFAEIAAAPLIIDSGGVRVFAASIGIRVLAAAVALQWLVATPFVWWKSARQKGLDTGSAVAHVPIAHVLVGLLLVAVLLPVASLQRLGRLSEVPAGTCPPGEQPMTTRFGRESVALTMTGRDSTLESVWPFAVGDRRVLGDEMLMGGAYAAAISAAPRPVTLVRAVDLSAGARTAIRTVAVPGEPAQTSAPQWICVDPKAAVEIANTRYELVRSWRTMKASN